MRGLITDSAVPGGLRLAEDFAEPEPAPAECVVEVRAFQGEDLAILGGLVADGRLRPRIGLVLDWRKTAEAFAALTRREVRGKAVMTIG